MSSLSEAPAPPPLERAPVTEALAELPTGPARRAVRDGAGGGGGGGPATQDFF